MRRITGKGRTGKRGLLLLAGFVGLTFGLFTMTMPDVQAYASYDPMTYYSAVVKSSAQANKIEPEDIVNSADDNKIIDHTECWGTRDCVKYTMPEDGTLKLHMKNTSDYWTYGSQLEIYADENLSYRLSAADMSVDGGGEADTSIYLEKGTYYIFVTSSCYEGDEFIEGDSRLGRRTQVWAGYVAQAPIFSVRSVDLSGDKTSATITLNLPEEYSTLRVEEGYIDYEDLKNETRWDVTNRTNMLEYNTYTARENGWYTFRLALNSEDKAAKGWGYLCRVKVSGIGGVEYKELEANEENLPEAVVGDETKTIPAVTSVYDMKQQVMENRNELYYVHAYRQTKKKIPVTIKESGTLCLLAKGQASTYKKVTVELYADKDCKIQLSSFDSENTKPTTWSLLPGTYYLVVTTAGNSSELNDTIYAERRCWLYAGFLASKQVMSQKVTLSQDKSSATIQFGFANALKDVEYRVYDYKVNKWQISKKVAGTTVDVENNSLQVYENGEYTIYTEKIGSKDHPIYYIDTFTVSGIHGEEYVRETKPAPNSLIPYGHSIAELLNNTIAGQTPFLSMPYVAWDYLEGYSGNLTKVQKVVFDEDTYVHVFTNGTGGIVKFYRDFQCTDLYKTINVDSDIGSKNIKAGTYYVLLQAKTKTVGTNDGIYVYAMTDLYMSGVKNSDLLSVSEPEYNGERTRITFTPRLVNNEKIGNVLIYNKHYERGGSFDDEYLVGGSEGNAPISLTRNGDYTVVFYPKNAANMGTNSILYHISVADLMESDDETQQPGTGETGGGSLESGTGETGGGSLESGTGETGGGSLESGTGETGGGSLESGMGETGGGSLEPGTGETGGGSLESGTGISGGESREPGTGGNAGGSPEPEECIETVKGLQYKITQGNASFIGVDKKGMKKIVIPDSVKVKGKGYNVTEIGANALKGNKKVNSLTVGKNVKRIGKSAFENCKKLSKITIKSAKLTKKSVGKNVLKGTGRKLVIKVPKKKFTEYNRLFKNKGNKNVMVKN